MAQYQCTYNDQNEVVALQDPNNANWKQLSKNEKLSEPFIRDNADFLDWNAVSAGQALTLSMLIDLKDKVKWKKIADNPHLDDDLKLIARYKLDFKRLLKKEKDTLPLSFIEKYYWTWQDSNDLQDYWSLIPYLYQLNEDFIHRFRYLLDWSDLRKQQPHLDEAFWESYTPNGPTFAQLSEQEILENASRMDWFKLSNHQQLSEAFIEQLIPLVGHTTNFWQSVSARQVLSDAFISKHQDNIDWKYLSFNPKKSLSEEMLLRFSDKDLSWNRISEHYHLSADTIEQLKDKLDWERLSCNKANCLTEDIIRKYEDRWHWPWIWYCQKLSEDFIREYIQKVKWDYIWECQTPVLSEQFFKEHEDKINWYKIQYLNMKNKVYGGYSYGYFTESFIRTFKDKVSWDRVALASPVSEDFIREFEDTFSSKAHWYWLILFQNQYERLSEAFIKDFQEKIDWEDAKTYDNGSAGFVRKFAPYVNWQLILGKDKSGNPIQYDEPFLRDFQDKFSKSMWKQISKEQQLSEAFIEDFQERLNWKLLSRHQQLSEPFIEKFEKKVNWPFIFKYQLLSPTFRKKFQHKVT
ncbi:MAG: hypothetical protein ACFB0B_13715 [Thermonemataceae bacterium]